MTYSEFLEHIKKFEGFKDHTYTDRVGVKTIGYGFTDIQYTSKLTMTRQEADKILYNLVKKTMDKVENYLISKGYIFDKNYLYALTDFTYNCGFSNLKLLTKDGKRTISEITNKIIEYNKGGGKVLKGLTIRRQWEQSLMIGTYSASDIQILCNSIIEDFEFNIEKLKVDGIIGSKSIDTIGKILSLIK